MTYIVKIYNGLRSYLLGEIIYEYQDGIMVSVILKSGKFLDDIPEDEPYFVACNFPYGSQIERFTDLNKARQYFLLQVL